MDAETFQRQGFMVLRAHVPLDEVARMSSEASALERMPSRPEGPWLYRDQEARESRGVDVLHRIEKFCGCAPVLARFVESAALRDLASACVGEAMIRFKEKINYKPPGGSGFAPHQDDQAGWDRFSSRFVSVLVALDPMTEANGCLEVSPGGHLRGRLGPDFAPIPDETVRALPWEPVLLDPGDAVVFDARTPHRSGPNATDRGRRALYVTFSAARDGDAYGAYHATKLAEFPPDALREPGDPRRYRV